MYLRCLHCNAITIYQSCRANPIHYMHSLRDHHHNMISSSSRVSTPRIYEYVDAHRKMPSAYLYLNRIVCTDVPCGLLWLAGGIESWMGTICSPCILHNNAAAWLVQAIDWLRTEAGRPKTDDSHWWWCREIKCIELSLLGKNQLIQYYYFYYFCLLSRMHLFLISSHQCGAARHGIILSA